MTTRAERKAAKSLLRIRALYAWGSSEYGQLGLGPEVKERTVPTQVSGFENTLQVAASGSHSLVLKTQGDRTAVYAFGRNDKHQLGLVDSPESSAATAASPGDAEAGAEDAAQTTSVVTSPSSNSLDATIASPRMSVGATKPLLNLPTLMSSLSDHRIVQVACGGTHAAALTAQGKLFSWGRGRYGQLGLGKDIFEQAIPREVTEMDGVHIASISAGGYHTAMVTRSNALYTCGMGSYGQLGHGDFRDQSVPTRVEALEDVLVSRVSCGDLHTAILSSAGDVYIWGSNEARQLGYLDIVPYEDITLLSSTNSDISSDHVERSPHPVSWCTPAKLDAFQNQRLALKSVSCGYRHTCVLTQEGMVYTFGTGDQGELGLGLNFVQATKPTLVDSLLGLSITRCHAANGFSAFISDIGELFICGKAPGGPVDKAWQPKKFVSGNFNETFVQSMSSGTDHVLSLIDTGELWRNRSIGRLVACERHYSYLMSLISRDISPVCESVVGKETWDSIIGCQAEIIRYHRQHLLQKLDALLEIPTLGHYSVGSLFVDLLSDPKLLELYSTYAANFGKAWEKFLGCLKTIPTLGSFLETVFARDTFQVIPALKTRQPEQFVHLLQAPTVHFAELLPLIEEVLRFTPDSMLPDQSDLNKADQLCRQADTMVRGSVAGSIEYLGLLAFLRRYPGEQSVLTPGRRFLQKSSFSPTESGENNLKIYIFNDLVVITNGSEVLHRLHIAEVFVTDVRGGSRPSLIIVAPLQSHRLYVRSQKLQQKLIETLDSAITEWIGLSIQNREQRSLIGIKMLTHNLDMVMPLLSKSWTRGLRSDSLSPRSPPGIHHDSSPATLFSTSGLPSMIHSLGEIVARTCSTMESDQAKRERIPIWGSLSLPTMPSLSSRSGLANANFSVCEPFIVYIDVPGPLKEKKFSSFSKAFAKKRKKALETLHTNMGTTQAGILSGALSEDSLRAIPRKYRIAIRLGGHVTVGDARECLYRSAASSPWAESLQLKPLQEYVLRVRGMQFYLTNPRLALFGVPVIQTILTATMSTPLIEMIALPKAGSTTTATSDLPTLPNIKIKDLSAIPSLFTPKQVRPNLDAELQTFDDVNSLIGNIQPLLLPHAEIYTFRHQTAGLRLQLLQEKRELDQLTASSEKSLWPQYKGLEAMPSKLPTKLTVQINVPYLNNETHTLQVPPDVTVDFIHSSIFRFIYKHEKHKTREKIAKFVKRMIETDGGHDSTSSEPEEEEVEYVDTKTFELTGSKLDLHISGVPLQPSGSKLDLNSPKAAPATADAVFRTDSGGIRREEPSGSPPKEAEEDPSSTPIEIVDPKPIKGKTRLERLALRASWKKEEDENAETAHHAPPSIERGPGTPSSMTVGDSVLGSYAEDFERKSSKSKFHPTPGTASPRGPPSPPVASKANRRSLIIDPPTPTASPSLKPSKDHVRNDSKDGKEKDKEKDHPREHFKDITISSVGSGEGEDSPRPARKSSKSNVRPEIQRISDLQAAAGSHVATPSSASTPVPQGADGTDDIALRGTNITIPLSAATQSLANAEAWVESSGVSEGESSADEEHDGSNTVKGPISKKEEEKLKKLRKEAGKKQKKDLERQRKEAKKAAKETMKKAKKEGIRIRKEEKREKKKQKHLHNGKSEGDFILKVNGVNEFLLPGWTEDRPTLLCDYDYVRRAISNQTPIELRFIEKTLVKHIAEGAATAAGANAAGVPRMIDLSIARYPPPVPRIVQPSASMTYLFDDDESSSDSFSQANKIPQLELANDTDTIEIYLQPSGNQSSSGIVSPTGTMSSSQLADSSLSTLYGDAPAKHDRPFWSLREDSSPFRVRLLDGEGLGLDLTSYRVNMYAIVTLSYGKSPGFCLKSMSQIISFDNNPQFNEDLIWPVKMLDLPREARITVAVYARVEYSNQKQKKLPSDVCLGWANVMLFSEQGSLKHGIHGLSLWNQVQKPDRLGTCTENTAADSKAPKLAIDICRSMVVSASSSFSSSGLDSQQSTIRKRHRHPHLPSPFFLSHLSSAFNQKGEAKSSASSPTLSDEAINALAVSASHATTAISILPVPLRDCPSVMTDEEKDTLNDLASRDALAEITPEEGMVMLRYRNWIRVHRPEALPKLLQFVDWSDRDMVKSIHEDVNKWPPISPFFALQLLDSKFPDSLVRTFAVNRCLASLSDNEVYRILLQLIQALKYEPYHTSSLALFLLRRAFWDSRRIGHFFFWQIKSEMQSPLYAERYSLMMDAFVKSCGLKQRQEFLAQNKILSWLHQIALEIKGRRGSVASKTSKLQERIAKAEWPERFNYPLDPRIECIGFEVDSCRVLGSKTVPLMITFKTEEPLSEPLQMIYKIGDDLRQDALTLQMIILMDDLWKRDGLDMRLKPYACMALGPDCGIIEVVKNASTTSNINIELGGLRAVLNDTTLLKWLKKHNPTEKQLNKAIENFIYSCAGYSVITFVLGFADRHNDNIMLSRQGHLFHIDFGHFLGHYRKVLGKYVDKADFVFIDQYEGVMGKENSERFESICCQAYNIIRQHSSQFITLFTLMLASGLPELQSEADIQFIKDRLQLHLTPEEAAEHFRLKLAQSRDNGTIQLNHAFHVVYQGMKS